MHSRRSCATHWRASLPSATSPTAVSSFACSGPRARDVLQKGVLIDLHPGAFKTGDVAVTPIAHIGTHLWQVDDTPAYEIAVFRSFADAFRHWLEEAGAEFGVEIAG